MKALGMIAMAGLFVFGLCGVATATDLFWDAPTTGGPVVGYHVYQDGVQIGDVPAPTTQYTLQNIVLDTTYLLCVSAYNSAGESARACINWTYEEDITIDLPRRPVIINIE